MSSFQTATSSTTTPAPTTLAPTAEKTARTTLEILRSTADTLKLDIEAFEGDKMLVSDFATQDQAILTKINDLVQKLPYTTPEEIGAVFNDLSALRGSYDLFLATYQGKIKAYSFK